MFQFNSIHKIKRKQLVLVIGHIQTADFPPPFFFGVFVEENTKSYIVHIKLCWQSVRAKSVDAKSSRVDYQLDAKSLRQH